MWNWLLPLAISGGTNILGGLFGGGRRTLSPEQQTLYNRLESLRAGGLPQHMTAQISAPYVQLQKLMERKYAGQPGVSGLMGANIERQVTTPKGQALAQAGTNWELGLLGQQQNLLQGTYGQPTDWGSIIGSMGGDAAFLAGLYKALGMQGGQQGGQGWDIMDLLKAGGGMQYQGGQQGGQGWDIMDLLKAGGGMQYQPGFLGGR